MNIELVFAFWLLSRSRYTRWLAPALEALIAARATGEAPVEVRGLRLDGAVIDLEGRLRRRGAAGAGPEESGA